MNVALCGVEEKIACELKCYGEYGVLLFIDEPEWRGDVKLAYFLRDGPPVALAVVGYPGEKGLAACDYLRTQNRELPILWMCNCREFEPEAKRIGVTFYGTGPHSTELLAARLLIAISKADAGIVACRSG